MSVELILLAVNTIRGHFLFLLAIGRPGFALLGMRLAAAEAAIGLAIMVVYYRKRGSHRGRGMNLRRDEPSLYQAMVFLPLLAASPIAAIIASHGAQRGIRAAARNGARDHATDHGPKSRTACALRAWRSTRASTTRITRRIITLANRRRPATRGERSHGVLFGAAVLSHGWRSASRLSPSGFAGSPVRWINSGALKLTEPSDVDTLTA